MKYVKSCLIITMLLGISYSQCDFAEDGEIDDVEVADSATYTLGFNSLEGEYSNEDFCAYYLWIK